MLFTRHAETPTSHDGRLDLDNASLSARGWGHAQEIGGFLGRWAHVYPSIEVVVHSPMARSRETWAGAEQIAPPGIQVIQDERLRELDWGEWRGLKIADIFARPDVKRLIMEFGLDLRPPGGETYREAGKRVGEVVDHYSRDNGYDPNRVMILGHGSATKGFFAEHLGWGRSETCAYKFGHAAVVSFDPANPEVPELVFSPNYSPDSPYRSLLRPALVG